jgi:hypothetical protein
MQKRQNFTKRQMYALIHKWESSGLSQEKFLQQHGIAKSTFAYWRNKYLRETGHNTKKGSFIPVKVESHDRSVSGFTGMIEIIYPNGVRLICSGE